jgi:tetratricopeptide (TPR) repeat protein
MTGICYMEKGDIKNAALSFARAKQCEGITEEQKIVLAFRLSKTLEQIGDLKKALEYCDQAAELYKKMRKEKPLIALLYNELGPGSSTVKTQVSRESGMIDLWDKIEETRKSLKKSLKKPKRRVSYM